MKKFIDRPNLKKRARAELAGDYNKAVPVTLLMLLLVGLPCAMVGVGLWFALFPLPLWARILLVGLITDFLFVLLKGPLSYGRAKFYVNMSRNEPLEVSQLIAGFNRWNCYWRMVFVKFLQVLYALIGFVLLVVPGIVVMYRYSMAYYVLADNPALSATEAMKKSAQLTKGNKPQLFALDLSYIGWWLLAVATVGIVLLWVLPNINTTKAYFYNVMADRQRDIKPKVDRHFSEAGGEIPPDGKIQTSGEIFPDGKNG